jgi:uncharacterized protein YndB with AHSA1/START domain
VYQVYIRTSPEQLWHAITDSEFTQRFFHRSHVESTWRPGDPIVYTIDGELVVEGVVVQADPPRKLICTWSFRRQAELRDDPPSRVTWEIEPVGSEIDRVCKLTLVHDDFASETRTFKSVGSGWPPILSSLKSLLETGEPLPIAR